MLLFLLSCLTAPVSACDERYIKKCERAAASAVAAEPQDLTPAAKKRTVKRVQVVASRRAKHSRLVKRRAPGFAVKQAGMKLASAASQPAALPESALSRRFRGFIDPRPMAQNAFEILRKPHLMMVNLEPPEALPAIEIAHAAPAAAELSAQAASIASTAKQDRIAPKPARMELASAESRPVVLPDLPKHGVTVTASMIQSPVIQAVASAAPSTPADQPSKFSFHALVLALCGALGAASALRFIVGA